MVRRQLAFLVFVVVTEQAEQLPVTAVRGVILEVVILVMDRQLTQPPTLELTLAARADVRQQLQGAVPIARLPDRRVVPQVADDLLLPLSIGQLLVGCHDTHSCRRKPRPTPGRDATTA